MCVRVYSDNNKFIMYLLLNTVTRGTTNFQRKEFINLDCVCFCEAGKHLEQKKFHNIEKQSFLPVNLVV